MSLTSIQYARQILSFYWRKKNNYKPLLIMLYIASRTTSSLTKLESLFRQELKIIL
jgi:hypothetical protein